MAVLTNFSKAFDTVSYVTVLTELHNLGFSKSYLRWITGYLTDTKQFVSINHKASETIEAALSIPQVAFWLSFWFSLLTYSNFTACRYFQYSRITASSTFNELELILSFLSIITRCACVINTRCMCNQYPTPIYASVNQNSVGLS